MKKIFFAVLILISGLSVCTAQSKAPNKTKTPKGTATRSTYRLMLDFISKGGGIDNESFEKIEAYAKAHPKKPGYNVNQKGKEGEKKMYFGLSELTNEEQYAFVDEVKKLIVKPDMVIVDSKLAKAKGKDKTLVAVGDEGTSINGKYRLIVTFISKGAGTDHKAAESIKNYIETHPKKPAFAVKTWGREGERDYLLSLKELNADEQKVFIDELKKLVTNPDLVSFRENDTYVKKGR